MVPVRIAAISAVLLVTQTACWFDDDTVTGPPCEDDVLGCDSNLEDFMIDPSCELEGELELVLGQGETTFSPLAPGEVPDINYGFQGGQHIWAALQVHNPATDYPRLRIDITVSACSQSDCTSLDAWTIDNTRQLVADAETMTLTPEGWFEQLRMLVVVEAYAFAGRGKVEVLVTDPCGRQGYVVVEGVPTE